MYNLRSITANIGRTYRRNRGSVLRVIGITLGIFLAAAAIIALIVGLNYGISWVVMTVFNGISSIFNGPKIGIWQAFCLAWGVTIVANVIAGLRSPRAKITITRTRYR